MKLCKRLLVPSCNFNKTGSMFNVHNSGFVSTSRSDDKIARDIQILFKTFLRLKLKSQETVSNGSGRTKMNEFFFE